MSATIATRKGRPAKEVGRSEVIVRDTTPEGETPFVEVTVRLSNGHFESSARASMGDKEGAKELVEAWLGAMNDVLPRFRR
jgi:hypothetical protein